MTEKWKDIIGYEGYYQVSDNGRVKSFHTNKILKKRLDTRKYLYVDLWMNGQYKRYRVHRLVLAAFEIQCPKDMECRHLDGNRQNNKLNNLKWGTRSENIFDAVKHKTHVDNRGSKNGLSKLTEKDIIPIIELLQNGKTQKEIGIMFNVTPSIISKVKLNQTWRHVKR